MAPPHTPAELDLPLILGRTPTSFSPMKFMLFAGDVRLAQAAEKAGIERIVVDLERRKKRERQSGYHLECTGDTLEDLARVRRAVKCEVLCRVNPVYRGTPREIESVLKAGADAIMLPMFRRLDEVSRFLDCVAGRARTSLLFETHEAVELAGRLDPSSFDEVYVGLNDLAISYGVPFGYQLLASGVLDRLRALFPHKPFGFGGITVLDGGAPLPTRQIVAEQARLRCTHFILRRAFKRDIQGRDMRRELDRLRAYYRRCLRRSPAHMEEGRRRVQESVKEILEVIPPGRKA